MKLAIIGAGIGGLIFARKATQYGIECQVFEATGGIGGQWYYHDPFTKHFGIPMHSSVYESMRVNGTYHTMELEGVEFDSQKDSYPHHTEVYKYIKKYAEHFNLYPHIEFNRNVERILRCKGSWILRIRNRKLKTVEIRKFDAVAICTGKYTTPKIPDLLGIEYFKGDHMHSRYYRKNDYYRDRCLLIIGGNESGLDIAAECSKVTKRLVVSHRTEPKSRMPNVEYKPDVMYFGDEGEVVFADGSSMKPESIIYCTGYNYNLNFLDSNCGIETDPLVRPLFRKFINIEHPTMCILGLVQDVLLFQMHNILAETFIKSLIGIIKLPSKEEMLCSQEQEIKEQCDGEPNNDDFFTLKPETVESYFRSLTDYANMQPLPTVFFSVYQHKNSTLVNDYYNSKNKLFQILDDPSYTYEN